MQRNVIAILIIALIVLARGTLVQAQPIETEVVRFASGSTGTTINNTLTGAQIIDYKIGVSAGQNLSVTLTTNNASNYFNITAPGANASLFIGSRDGNNYSGTIPSSGDYTVRVYLMRNAARRNETANYQLSLSATGGGNQSNRPNVSPDFADGLTGGPDFWEVTGLTAGDTLNLRSGMGTNFGILAKLASGEIVANRGCRMNGNTRWCQVQRTADGLTGWVAGRYLREASRGGASAPQAAPQPQANGLAGNGEPFSATGNIPCSAGQGQPTRNCAFGVVRTSVPGNASVWVGIGGGTERFIMFEKGAPNFTDAQAPLLLEKSSDLNVIKIGQELYEIPDAVIFGG